MTTLTPAQSRRFSRPGANPTLETIEYIRSALSAAGGPLSRNRLLGILAEWGHATTRRSLNAALAFFLADAIVAEAPGGLIWVPTAPEDLLRGLEDERRAVGTRRRTQLARF